MGYGIVLKASLVQLTECKGMGRQIGVVIGGWLFIGGKRQKENSTQKKKERNCKENLKDYALWDWSKGLLPRQKLFCFLLFNYTVLLDSCLQQSFEIINLYLDLQEGSISAVENYIKIF